MLTNKAHSRQGQKHTGNMQQISGPVHVNMSIFKTTAFSMWFGHSFTHKHSIRSLKPNRFKNSCLGEDFQKLQLQCCRVAGKSRACFFRLLIGQHVFYG